MCHSLWNKILSRKRKHDYAKKLPNKHHEQDIKTQANIYYI